MNLGIVLQKRKTDIIKKGSHYMDLAFGREWGNIALVKAFFENFVLSKMDGTDDVHKVGIAVSELLENAVKYSNKDGVRIIIQKMKKNGSVKIRVFNCANKQHISNLKSRLKEMQRMDSLDFYLYRMRESVKDKKASPGLGLARVYHEAQAEITARYYENEKVVEVKAAINLSK
jgi:hypothetical protein